MSDNVVLPGTGISVAADEINSVQHQLVKMEFGADGTATPVSAADPLPVAVSFPATQPVIGTVEVSNQPVQPLTDAQLRAASVPVSLPSATSDTPLPVADGENWILRMLSRVLGRFSFDSAGKLRMSDISTISTITTVTTVNALASGNMGMGDMGKPATAQLVSQQNFQCGTGRNISRS